MAGSLSNYLKNELRKHVFRTGSFTKPTTLYMALFTTATTDAGGGTEVTGGSYARVQVGPSDAAWTAHATDGRTQNASTVTFATPTATWGTITHTAFFDAITGGNMLFHQPLTTSRTVNNGDPAPAFNANAVDFQWD